MVAGMLRRVLFEIAVYRWNEQELVIDSIE